MKNFKNKKTLQICLFVLIAVVTLGIGYASITAINLFINGNATASVNQSNFNVHFTGTPTLGGNVTPTGSASISQQDNKVALFDVGGMTKVGDYAEAIYTVLNDSNGVGADITLNVTNSNSEYFKVTETVADSQLQAGDTTTATVKVEMIKTPIENAVTTSVTAKLIASPIDNASATGNSGASAEPVPDPVSFSTDSWATIQKAVQDNNTSAYHIGDTKTVTINNVDYTVRIANKSTYDWCGDEGYSQTACGFVVEFVDCVTTMQMRDSFTNVGGYPTTLIYDYLNDTLYGQLPENLKSVIKSTRVVSGHGLSDSSNFISLDKIYLLSAEEVYGADDGEYNFFDTAYGTSHQIEYYSSNEVTYSTSNWSGTNLEILIKQYNSSNTWWWLRHAASNDFSGFRTINQIGHLSNEPATGTGGVSPAFRIG